MGMLAFACNRRCNGLQLENSVAFLSCGVTETVNSYLNYIGLSSSRQTAISAMKSVGEKAAEKIRLIFSKESKLAPSIVLDNIDMQERIHHTRLDARTKMYHGTWGYVHPIDQSVLEGLHENAFDKDKFLNLLKPNEDKPIDASTFFPDLNEQEQWKLRTLAQIGTVLIRHVKNPKSAKRSKLFRLPSIDQIKCVKPDILMLKMMDSADNGTEGVGRLTEEVIYQTGLTPKEFARRLQIWEGNLGTMLNFRGLQDQRDPTQHAHEGLRNLMLLPGAGHTLWNIAQAILLHHWGDPSDINDFGAWQTVVALGGKKEAPTAKRDFTSMLGWIEKIHESTISYALW